MANQTSDSNQRRVQEVLATADVAIRQVRTTDKTGKDRAIVVWECGADVFWADTIDGLFDVARRKAAPAWLIEQMRALPDARKFHSNGTPYAEAAPKKPRKASAADSDMPTFAQE